MDMQTVSIQDLGVNGRAELKLHGAVDNYEYLITLLDSYNKDLLDKSFHSSFLDLTTFALMEKQDINKTVFTSLAVEDEPTVNTEDIKKALIEAVTSLDIDILASDNLSSIRRDRDNARGRVRYNHESADSAYANYREYMNKAQENAEKYEVFKAQLVAMKTDDNINHPLADAISSIIATGDWDYMGTNQPKLDLYNMDTSDIDTDDEGECEDDYTEEEWSRGYTVQGIVRESVNRTVSYGHNGHWFCSTKPMVVRQVNTLAGVNESFKAGHVMVSLTKHGEVSTAQIVGDCVFNNHNSHPHLSGTSICWGTGYDPMRENARKEEYGMLTGINMFKNLMETYCPNAPYITIQDLKEVEDTAGSRFKCLLSQEYLEKLPEPFIPSWVKPHLAEIKAEHHRQFRYFDVEKNKLATKNSWDGDNPLGYSRTQDLANKTSDFMRDHARCADYIHTGGYTEITDRLFVLLEENNCIMSFEDFKKLHRVNIAGYLREFGIGDGTVGRKFRAYIGIMALYYRVKHKYDIRMLREGYASPDEYLTSGTLERPTNVTGINSDGLVYQAVSRERLNGRNAGAYYAHKLNTIFIEEIEDEQE